MMKKCDFCHYFSSKLLVLTLFSLFMGLGEEHGLHLVAHLEATLVLVVDQPRHADGHAHQRWAEVEGLVALLHQGVFTLPGGSPVVVRQL